MIEKSSKGSRFFWSFDFELPNDSDDEKSSVCDDSTSFEFFFKKEVCLLWILFSTLRLEIVISFDVITLKSKLATETKELFFANTNLVVKNF